MLHTFFSFSSLPTALGKLTKQGYDWITPDYRFLYLFSYFHYILVLPQDLYCFVKTKSLFLDFCGSNSMGVSYFPLPMYPLWHFGVSLIYCLCMKSLLLIKLLTYSTSVSTTKEMTPAFLYFKGRSSHVNEYHSPSTFRPSLTLNDLSFPFSISFSGISIGYFWSQSQFCVATIVLPLISGHWAVGRDRSGRGLWSDTRLCLWPCECCTTMAPAVKTGPEGAALVFNGPQQKPRLCNKVNSMSSFVEWRSR